MLSFAGLHSSTVVIRGCLDVDGKDVSGCKNAEKADIPLKFLEMFTGVSLDAEVCYCNTDLCVAKPCEGGFIIRSWWYV